MTRARRLAAEGLAPFFPAVLAGRGLMAELIPRV
jgi:hypothetical protein